MKVEAAPGEVAAADRARPVKQWAADTYERVLAGGAIVLLVVLFVALVRGRPHWHDASTLVWLHLVTIIVALALTPVMLLRDRGDRLHRSLGWVWAAGLFLTAALSFLIRQINHGQFSIIHILSAFTLVQVPLLVRAARRHDIKRHRRGVRGMVTGALLIAGFFTFPFGRMLGQWLYG